MNIKFMLVREGARLPERGTPRSGAFDLFAPESGFIRPNEVKVVPMGIAHEVPDTQDNVFQLHGLLISRSGLAVEKKIKLFFDPCLIDHDYRGEIKAVMFNGGESTFFWAKGYALCQIAYVPMFSGDAEQVFQLTETKRGAGGFGHTDKKVK